jgi:hypothetical protein
MQRGCLSMGAPQWPPSLSPSLLADLGVTKSLQPASLVERQPPIRRDIFCALKYRHIFPARIGFLEDAHDFCRRFSGCCNSEHRHTAMAFHTPADVSLTCRRSRRRPRGWDDVASTPESARTARQGALPCWPSRESLVNCQFDFPTGGQVKVPTPGVSSGQRPPPSVSSETATGWSQWGHGAPRPSDLMKLRQSGQYCSPMGPCAAAVGLIDADSSFGPLGREGHQGGSGQVTATPGGLAAGVRAVLATPGGQIAGPPNRAGPYRYAIVTRRGLSGHGACLWARLGGCGLRACGTTPRRSPRRCCRATDGRGATRPWSH